jgi:serine/threonine protein kinase
MAAAPPRHPSGAFVTLLVCSNCQSTLPEDSPRCPRCGPGSLTFIISEDPAAGPRGGDVPRRLVRALGLQYEVVGLLGSGGFAEVYEVRDTELQRRLAVKVLRPDVAWTAGMLARFKQEARAIARLSHPHTVPIHFVGEGEGLVFYVMPFVEGTSLSRLLRTDGPLAPERAIALAIPILDALEHAHRHGLVHRDIKPDNIMIEAGSGRPMIVDFGIAKSLDGGASHTQDGFVVGTPLYMSPEQALGHRNVDARTDIYAMGAMLYQMLTGTPPFDGASSQEIVGKHLTEPVPSIADRRIPRGLTDVVLRAMAKQPGERYPSAAAMLEALQAVQGGGAATTSGATPAAATPADATPSTPVPPTASVTPSPILLEPVTLTPTVSSDATTAKFASDEITPTPAPPRAAAPARTRRWLAIAAGVAALAAVGFGFAWALRPQATLVVRNGLVEPVRLAVAGDVYRVAPGDSLHIPLGSPDSLHAEWVLVRPRSADGSELGAIFGGTIDAKAPRGEIRRTIEPRVDDQVYFAPSVRNATGSLVRVEVVGGDAPPCECAVAAGEHDTHLGYYPLARDVAVELTDSAGRTTTIGDLEARLAAGSGVVPLDVSDASFPTVADRRAPARPASHVEALGARAVHPAPALSPLTETGMVRDGAAPDAQAAATPESTAHAGTHAAPGKPKSKSSAKQADPPRDPLRGIFPRR